MDRQEAIRTQTPYRLVAILIIMFEEVGQFMISLANFERKCRAEQKDSCARNFIAWNWLLINENCTGKICAIYHRMKMDVEIKW